MCASDITTLNTINFLTRCSPLQGSQSRGDQLRQSDSKLAAGKGLTPADSEKVAKEEGSHAAVGTDAEGQDNHEIREGGLKDGVHAQTALVRGPPNPGLDVGSTT
jgi:hypothetical protein